MSDPGSTIDYPARLQRAMRALVHELLWDLARDGIPEGSELYLSFRTDRADVELPDSVRESYPEETTIVLRPRFCDGLSADNNVLAATMQFSGVPARIQVPFAALTRFVDPAAQLAIDLSPTGHAAPEEPPFSPGSAPNDTGDNVVSFDRTRRKR